MSDDVVLGTMAMDEFKALRRAHRALSPQRVAIRGMQAGDVLILSHKGLSHQKKSGSCTLYMILSLENENGRGLRYAVTHLRDGNVAVACTAQES